MTQTIDPQQALGRTAVDSSGDKVGKVGQIYLDDRTGQPTWVTVSTGLFGNNESFAPFSGATADDEGNLRLAVTKAEIKDAPNVAADGHLSDDETARLYEYYSAHLGGTGGGYDTDETTGQGVDGVGGTVEGGVTGGTTGGQVRGQGHDTSGPNTDDAMTRSEEQLHVGTQNVETGRARLRKYVVTENVTQTVPVSHEEVRIEREPITEANAGDAYDGPAISEEEHEVTLHAERPVVEKEAVPVERVRLGTETVTDQQQVSEEVRKEQIDVDGDGTTTR